VPGYVGLTPMWRIPHATPTALQFATDCNGYYGGQHRGAYPQAATDATQFFLMTSWDPVTPGSAGQPNQSIAYIKCDGTDEIRLVCGFYGVNPLGGGNRQYYGGQGHAQPSADGTLILFGSNMLQSSGRVDSFVAEVPLT
jgi:hypothetical protein